MNTSQKLKLIKQLSQLTQESLAKELGVSFVTLNTWINGKSEPRIGKQKVIEELYLKLTGQRVIPEKELEAKKQTILNKRKRYKNIVTTIRNNPDIYNQFILSLTFNSNRIEGSTLTEDETADVLFNNASIPNKNLIEHLEAKNHQTALDFLFNNINSGFKITEVFILKLHSILMNGIRADAGEFRQHGVRIVGSNVPTANYVRVPAKMKELLKKINGLNKDTIDHVSEVHSIFEQVHPFSDGNGRIGRILMHAMLLKSGCAPATIKEKDKKLYLTYLRKSQLEQDFSQLEDFMCDAVIQGFQIIERREI